LPELLPSVEIGWRFGKAHRGKGYATEAARAALAVGARTFADEGLVSVCQVENRVSARIMAKLGLCFERQTSDRTCGREVDIYRLN
jgi:RimJ/RimL family protein N-acetyltransferase